MFENISPSLRTPSSKIDFGTPYEFRRYLIFFQTPWADLTASCWSYTLKYICVIFHIIYPSRKKTGEEKEKTPNEMKRKNWLLVARIHSYNRSKFVAFYVYVKWACSALHIAIQIKKRRGRNRTQTKTSHWVFYFPLHGVSFCMLWYGMNTWIKALSWVFGKNWVVFFFVFSFQIYTRFIDWICTQE